MPIDNESIVAFLVPRCFRRKKTLPTSETVENIFEQRMKQRLKKQNKWPSRPKYRPVKAEFATFDLLAARDRSAPMKIVSKSKQKQWAHMLSWDSITDTYISPPSSVGAEAGGIIGTTHRRSPCEEDSEISSRYTAQLTRQEVSPEAAFRLQQLAQLDMRNSAPSFVYQVPRQSARKWSMTTAQGSVGD